MQRSCMRVILSDPLHLFFQFIMMMYTLVLRYVICVYILLYYKVGSLHTFISDLRCQLTICSLEWNPTIILRESVF